MSGSPQCEHTWFLVRVVVSASVEPPIALVAKLALVAKRVAGSSDLS